MSSMKLDILSKVCKDCKKDLPINIFSKDKSYKDGFSVRCRPCKRSKYNPKLAEWRRDIRDEALRAKEGISLRYIQDRLSSYKSRAKQKSYSFDLDSEFLLELWKKQGGLCFYTKQKMNIIHLTYDFWSPSLDRLNPDKGYIKDNVAWTLHGVNCFKQQLTLEQFLTFVNSVKWPSI